MEFCDTVILKDGRECVIRNGVFEDGKAVLENYILTHRQTENLLAYADETDRTVEDESEWLDSMKNSPVEIQLLAFVGGYLAGMAGVNSIGRRIKLRHRASLGVSVDEEYWGLGIGRALLERCIICARKAGYEQLELDVVSDNERALGLYERLGFKEWGRNPKAFKTRDGRYQELIAMRLEL